MFIPAVIDWAKNTRFLYLINDSPQLCCDFRRYLHADWNQHQSGGQWHDAITRNCNPLAYSRLPGRYPRALLGMAYILTLGKWLLPDRKPAISQLENPREYSIEVIVEAGSPLEGKTIEQAGLRNLPGMYLVEINRGEQVIPAVSPQEKLLGNDHLVFVGIVESVVDLHKIRGLTPATNQVFKLESPGESEF